MKAREQHRPPWCAPSLPDAYSCRVENPGFDCYGGERTANTAWGALRKAVSEVVIPAETGEEAVSNRAEVVNSPECLTAGAEEKD